MRALFVSLVAITLGVFFSAQLVMAQGAAAPDPALQKAQAARAKQIEAAGKGDARAIEAEAKLKTDAMAQAPLFIKDKSLPCTLTDARTAVVLNGNVMLELACQEGIGFMVVGAPDGSKGQAQECIDNPAIPLPVKCALPANANPAKALQPFLVRAGSNCVVAKAVTLSATAQTNVYEVACESGVGQMLSIARPRTDASKVVVASCLAFANATRGAKCTLTTEEANLAPSKALAAKAGRPCTLTNQRYVGGAPDGSDYFEYACGDGSGFMILADAKGEYLRTLSCVQATGVLGGCKLTDAAAAVAAQTGVYTQLVKQAGFNCDVSKFTSFPPKAGSTADVVELACANRPDGAVAMINNNKPQILNCVVAASNALGCGLSKPEAAYAALTDNLKQAGKQTCVVNGAKAMGASRSNAYVEVTCSDGVQGFILQYPLGEGKPTEAIVCSEAGGLGGGCSLPGNKKNG